MNSGELMMARKKMMGSNKRRTRIRTQIRSICRSSNNTIPMKTNFGTAINYSENL